MKIGDKIKKARIDKGLTQKELGNILGVSQAMIGQYEKGARHPKAETLKKFSNALDIPYSDFFDFNHPVIASHDESTITIFLHDEIDKNLYYGLSELNSVGKEKTLIYIEDLANNPKYKKDK